MRDGGPRAGKPRPRPACAPDRARAPGLRGLEPQAPRRRADRALAGERHGREPRRGREGERRGERAAAHCRRPVGLRSRIPGCRRLRARHQGRAWKPRSRSTAASTRASSPRISPEVRSGQVTGRVKFAGDQPAGPRQSQRGSVRIVIEQRAKAVKFERSSDIVRRHDGRLRRRRRPGGADAGRARRRLRRRDRSPEGPRARAGSRDLRLRRPRRRSRIPHRRMSAATIQRPWSDTTCSRCTASARSTART